jgi:hypothetical protein
MYIILTQNISGICTFLIMKAICHHIDSVHKTVVVVVVIILESEMCGKTCKKVNYCQIKDENLQNREYTCK